MRKAEKTIADLKAAYLNRTTNAWKGREREFVSSEMVRGLLEDEAAFAFQMAPNGAELRRKGFLPASHDDGRRLRSPSLPRSPATTQRGGRALGADFDRARRACGPSPTSRTAARLPSSSEWPSWSASASLAEAKFLADDHLVLEATSGADEADELHAGARLSEARGGPLREQQRKLAAPPSRASQSCSTNVSTPADGWFIGYDNTDELVAYHRELARIWATGIAEAEALPPDAMLGGRCFAEWNEASVVAFGAVLQHIAFATRLRATTRGLELRNLLTVFARKDDVSAVWHERGENAAWSARLTAALTLDAESALKCEQDHEIPLPYYIDVGQDFVLLPTFGGLMNPCAGLVWHVRAGYRPDWDRAVGGREALFRDDLRSLLPPSRYLVPPRGAILRRPDGSHLTDLDATIVDRSTGELVLVQLKWPDIHGRSLAERNSRRLNLLKANDWVEKVSGWVGGRSAGEVAAQLGLEASGRRPPVLVVLARYTARFAGEKGYDPRARWTSWPGLVQAYRQAPRAGIVSALRRRRESASRASNGTSVSTHHLPGLKVEIRVD